MTPAERAMFDRLAARVEALERARPQGPTVMTGVGGNPIVRPIQLGFPAELTGTYNATTGYPWKRLFLNTATPAFENPNLQQTGNQAFEVGGSTTLASGTKVWLEPSPETNGYVLYIGSGGGSGGTTGFFARLTTSSGGAWKWYRLKVDSGGAWVDDGSESASFNAYPSTIDGTDVCNPVAGLRVWMIQGQTAGKYEFLPTGYASDMLPGLVSTTTQSFAGDKTFTDNVTVDLDLLVGDDLTVLDNADVGGWLEVDSYGRFNDNVYVDQGIRVGSLAGWPSTTGTPRVDILESANIDLVTDPADSLDGGSSWRFAAPIGNPPRLHIQCTNQDTVEANKDPALVIVDTSYGAARYAVYTPGVGATYYYGQTFTRAAMSFRGGIVHAAETKPTISGSRGGNAALANLLTALAASPLSLIVDATTA